MIYSRYLKTSVRFLFNNRLYALLNIAGLAIAFSAVILIGLYLIHEFGTDKHFTQYENLYRLNRGDDSGLAIPLKEALADEFSEFEKICRLQPYGSVILSVDKNNVRTGQSYFADSSVFELFDIELMAGADKDFNTPQTIFLCESLSRTLFDTLNPIGKSLEYEGQVDLTVKGVYKDLPSNSHIEMDFLIPISIMPTLGENYQTQYETYEQWGSSYYVLMNNSSLIDKLDDRLNQFIKTVTKNDNWEMHIQPFADIYFDSEQITDENRHGNKKQLQILLLVAIGIVVIGAVNYFNLTSATSLSRTREIAVKKALGVSKKELFSQFIVETVLLVFISVIIGFILAELMVPYLNSLYDLNLEVKLLYSARYLFWIMGIVVCFGIFTGTYPAYIMTKLNVLKLFHKSFISNRKKNPIRTLFIIFQYSVTTMLFISVFTINKQVKYLVNLDPGFDKEQLIYLSLSDEVVQSFEGFKSSLLQNPSVQGVSQSANVPGQAYWQNMVDMNGERVIFMDCIVDPSYADVLGIKMAEGDFIQEGSGHNQQLVLNESAVELLGLDDPIGYAGIWGIPVVGVVQDFNYQSMHSEIKPMMIRYAPYFFYATIRVGGRDMENALRSITEEWESHFPDHPIEYHFFDQEFEALYYSETRFGRLITSFSIIAMLISCIGLFGLTSFMAKKYATDSGIKTVFGASALQLFGYYLFRFIKWQGIAVIIGLTASWFILNQWLDEFAYRCSIPAYGIVLSVAIIVLISVLTVLYHALRIAKQNPVDVIRSE
jgi:putative ABC transport system permease protein